jgi:DNA recombination protein RmuC
MNYTDFIIGLITGSVLAIVVFLISRKKDNSTLNIELIQKELEEAHASNKELHARIEHLIATNASNEANLKAAQLAIEEEKALINELKIQLKNEFKVVSSEIVDERVKHLTSTNENQLNVLINPLKDSIKDFRSKLEEKEKQDTDRASVIRTHIEQLIKMNEAITHSADGLTKALKGDNKIQGNWGEMILESVLEKSGLVRDQEYTVQHSAQNDDDDRIRPDVIVHLPDKKHIIVDSKVSLTAFHSFVNTENEDEQKKYLNQHIESIKGHIKKLSEKKYESSESFITPDFVLLFMPIEPALTAAFRADGNLFQLAWEKNIILVSPTTLLATLRTVASVWAIEKRSKNAEEIAKLAGKFVDKLESVFTHLDKVEKKISGAQADFHVALGLMKNSPDNLIKRAVALKEMGAKSSKNIEKRLPSSEENGNHEAEDNSE